MLHDWFQPLEVSLTADEFIRLPRHAAYRYEFRNAQATITPVPRYQHCVLPLDVIQSDTTRDVMRAEDALSPWRISSVTKDDWGQLPRLFEFAFARVPPLLHLGHEERRLAVKSLVEATKAGRDGPLVANACVVARREANSEILGCLLTTLVPQADLTDFTDPNWQTPADSLNQQNGRPHVTWIAVSPQAQRRGLAGAMLSAVITSLQQQGWPTLISTILVGDTVSSNWHWRMGFELLSAPSTHSQRERHS